MNLPESLAPFQSRNYRFFYAGRASALPGMWITQTAIGWLVYELTQSTAMSGIAMFLGQVSHFFISPFAGVMFDRTNRFTMLLAVQFGALASALALTAFAVFDGKSVGVLFALCFFRGVVSAVEIPTRQSLVSQFVERREHLPQAVGLNSTLFNFVRIVAPAAAGEVYSRAGTLLGRAAQLVANCGAAACFALDALFCIPSILFIFKLRFDGRPPAGTLRESSPLAALFEGIRYMISEPILRTVVFSTGIFSTFALSYTVLLPMFAREVYAGTPELYGRMLTVTGVGAILAALTLAVLKRERLLPRFLISGMLMLGVALAIIALRPSIAVFFSMLFLAGFGSVLFGASANTLVQMNVNDRYCGRVVSLYAMAFTGTFPFGTLLLGWLNELCGIAICLGLSTFVSFGLAGYIFSQRKIFTTR